MIMRRTAQTMLRRPLLASPSISPFAPLPLHPRRSFASTPIQASNSLTVRQTNAVATRPPSFPPETAERIIEIMTPQKPDVEPKQLKRHATSWDTFQVLGFTVVVLTMVTILHSPKLLGTVHDPVANKHVEFLQNGIGKPRLMGGGKKKKEEEGEGEQEGAGGDGEEKEE